MVLTDKLNRAAVLAIAGLLFLASLVPLLTREKAGAYGLLPSRSITMSTSQQGATNVTYHVRFDIASTEEVGGIVVDFCDDSPIIGDTSCVLPTGFSITATPAVSGQSTGANADPIDAAITGDCNLTTFTTADDVITTRALVLTAAAPVAMTQGQTCFFDITTVTNPTTANHTFYSRIYTFSEAAEATGYTVLDPNAGTGTVNDAIADIPGNTGNDDANIDAGGIALSTAEQITVTAKVQERLSFCVYTYPTVAGTDTPPISGLDAADNNCTSKSGSDVILGDENGVLDPDRGYVDKTAYFSITTNAAGQAAVRMKGSTLKLTPSCDDDDTPTPNGFCRIEATGATPVADAEGTEQFGMCLYQYSTVTGATLGIANGTGGLADYSGTSGGQTCSGTVQSANRSVATPADDADHNGATFTFDTANTAAGGYGQIIATKAAGGYSTGNLVFLGNISNTTEPGIYRTTLTFVATGTY